MAWVVGTSFDDILFGTVGNDVMFGLAGDDVLAGASGNDTLDGGLGADDMFGGQGDDTYIVDNSGDVVHEDAGEGIDEVWASVTFTLGTNVEHLFLTGSAAINGFGNGLDNEVEGNSAANWLVGGAGKDILDGEGGNDVLWGGTDNDILRGGTGDDTLSGGSGNDTLSGGTGADNMSGGADNDTYFIDNIDDVVTELAGNGTDTVYSSKGYTLGANLEHLVLTGTAGYGTGNGLDNHITGNAGVDTLSGEAGNDIIDGGLGLDTMYGGTGNDMFYVDDPHERPYEYDGEGTDTILTSVTYQLQDYQHIENLVLTGPAAINGSGNSRDNLIIGNSNDNFLSGHGGDDTMWGLGGNDTLRDGFGNNTLSGGLGDDTYYFAYGLTTGTDVFIENPGEGVDTVWSGAGAYTLPDNFENLTLLVGFWPALNGTGNDAANVIRGNGAQNILDGAGAADILFGGADNDRLIGGTGLMDIMNGEAGADVFEFASAEECGLSAAWADQLPDFSEVEGDKIDLSNMDANTITADIQDFVFIGTDAAFSNVAGELRFTSGGYVEGDTDGDGAANFFIAVNATSMTGSGFLL